MTVDDTRLQAVADARLPAIEKRVDGALNFFRPLSVANQRYNVAFGTVQIMLAAAIPILALTLTTEQIYAAIAGGFLAIAKGIETLIKPQEAWLRAAATVSGLYSERALFMAKAGAYATANDRVALYAENVDRVLSNENTQWQQSYTKMENVKGP